MNRTQEPDQSFTDAAAISNQTSRADRPETASADVGGETAVHFRDRREKFRVSQEGLERRQFSSSYHKLSPAGAELGKAIDSYKIANHRRYITYDEILVVLETLGYQRPDAGLSGCSPHPLAAVTVDATSRLSPTPLPGQGFLVTDGDT
jgi:hypothetical protein